MRSTVTVYPVPFMAAPDASHSRHFTTDSKEKKRRIIPLGKRQQTIDFLGTLGTLSGKCKSKYGNTNLQRKRSGRDLI